MSEALSAALKRWFGFSTFRPGQEQIVRLVIEGHDAVVVMPTGSGKSLCFQLPALMLPGTTLVVSPLIALMKDQVDALTLRRIPATFLNSSLSADEVSRRLAAMRLGRYKLVYVAPERFRNPRFLEALRAMPLSMLAIDEAHCISAWGHDFRPDYLHLGNIVAALPKSVRLLAVTATATDEVRHDIAQHLRLGMDGRQEPEVVVTGFARPNLFLSVTRVRTHAEKLERALQAIEFFRTGILYCATRKMVDRVRLLLAEHGVKALAYSGGMADDERTRVQEAFMHGEAPVVVATNAFGMGVDRRDIRFVIHWDMPGSLEAYYQEVGRAGRDGLFAWCELLFNYADVHTQEFFIESATPTPEHVYELYSAIRNTCAQGAHGEASLSPEDWAACAGLKSPLAVRNLVALFERHGLLFRERRVGSPYSIITVPPSSDREALASICANLSQKETADRTRLRDMLDFVGAHGCRHRFLMAYFGERVTSRACRKCDICRPLATFPPRLQPTPEKLLTFRKELSCVARMHGVGDYALVAEVLRGTAGEPWRALTTYGLLPQADAAELVHDCEALEMDGYLTGMTLTQAGYELAIGKGEVPKMAIFQPRAAAPRPTAHARKAAATPVGPETRPGLATALRAWVAEEAERRSLPPFMVLQSKTIAALARKRPTSFAELELIPGLGDAKIAKFGSAIIDLIESYELSHVDDNA